MVDNVRIFNTALQIRAGREAARAVDEQMRPLRLALEEDQAANVEVAQELQQKTTDALLSLTSQISALVAAMSAAKPVV